MTEVVNFNDLPMPPPRTIEERIRLAIYWSLQGAVTKDALPSGVFIKCQLGFVGLKLVWADGSEISEEAWADSERREREKASTGS
jgi:hypothetical protein